MFKEAQGIGCKVQILLSHPWLRVVPRRSTIPRNLLLLPQFLGKLFDEAITIVGWAEAMSAHGRASDQP
jgi:hypothetical protein